MRITKGALGLALAVSLASAQETPPPQQPAAPAAPPASGAQEVPLPALYKSLAEKNHYAVVEGLKSAQADVKCGILDTVIAAFPDAAGKPIAVKFYWSRPDENSAPKKKFVVSGVPEALTDLSTRAAAIFKEAEDFVINNPDYWAIVNTDAKAVSEGGKIVVTGVAKNPADAVKKVMMDISAADYRVTRTQMDLGQASIEIGMTGKDLGGKWGIESTTLSYPQYKKVVKFEYVETGGFWLPAKMSIEFLGLDGKELQPTFHYEFSNWQVNQPLPEGAI